MLNHSTNSPDPPLSHSIVTCVCFRSSLSGWSVGSQDATLRDVDYISFLFSTLTGQAPPSHFLSH